MKIAEFHSPVDSQTKVVVRRMAGEYLCKLYTGGSHYAPADYFTEDREDALTTAQKMLERASPYTC